MDIAPTGAAWQATDAPRQLLPQVVGPVEPVANPAEPLPPVAAVAPVAKPGASVPAMALVAPAITAFLPGQARAAALAREVPVSYEPRAIEPARDPEMPVATAESLAAALVSEEPPARAGLAQRRLFDTVPDDIEPYFDLFMYVSKARRGPLAQHMFVFQREADGRIVPYAEWKVSTGREKFEINQSRRVRTTTPEGIFQIDPDRMHKRYWSRSWDNAPMHYAMFYDMMNNGRQTGLAIHAAVGKSKIARLGRRDSAGCVRLAPGHAKELFFKVQTATRGTVPVLAVNEKGSTDRWGRVQRDEKGAMMLQEGYRAVLFVENYDGREEISGPVVAYTH